MIAMTLNTTLNTFYVIMKSINIFSVYYETVAGQIRLMNGKHRCVSGNSSLAI